MAGLVIPGRFPEKQTIELAAPYKSSAVFFASLTEPTGKDIVSGNNLAPGSMAAPTLLSRVQGKTSYFDGATTRISTSLPIAPTPQFTVLCWARPAALNTGYARLMETDYLTGFYLGSNTASQYALIINNGALEGCIGGQQVAGQRDFVAGVFDGTSGILYVNGIQVASVAATAPTNVTNVLAVGAYPSANNVAVWNGDIDNIGIFNRAFSAAELYALTQNPNRLFKGPTRRLWLIPQGSAAVTGTIAVTEGNDTSAAQGSPVIVGSVAASEGGDTSNAQGTTTVTGTVAYTESADTCSASGSIGTAVSGTISVTEANDSVVSQGTTTVTGTVTVTEGADTSTAQGSPVVAGTLAITESSDTISAQGTTTVTGTIAVTEGADTSAASGAAGTAITGTIAVTEDADTSAGQGTTTVTGTIAATEGNDTCSAQGAASVVTGTINVTEGNDTLAAQGYLVIYGTIDQTEGYDTLSAFGIVNSGVITETALTTTATAATGQIKKPGIPVGTPSWLKTMIEIITGRRGNRITIPAEQTLTFSSTPTKEECEALLAYTNQVRSALEQIITRLDS